MIAFFRPLGFLALASVALSICVAAEPADIARRIEIAKAGHNQATATRTDLATQASASESSAPTIPKTPLSSAYPPYCLSIPLPTQPSGPVYRMDVPLTSFDRVSRSYGTEIAEILIWRISCGRSYNNGYFPSAALMRMQRQPSNEGREDVVLMHPALKLVPTFGPGGVLYDLPRLATEPNTVLAEILPGTPIEASTTFVLENYDMYYGYDRDFGLRIDNFATGTPSDFHFLYVGNYDPNPDDYPAAFQDLPISGYMSSNYYDVASSGEGIVLQIYRPAGNVQHLVISYSWMAYGPDGLPFWLYGQTDIPQGARSATVPIVYRSGGALGGNGGPAGAMISWGMSTISFPTCNQLTFTYVSNSDLPANIPRGSGTRTWQRVANIDQLRCQL